ncbi:MAG: hypothetical protein WCE21_00615 [Candidatus Babeliales bacterium]
MKKLFVALLAVLGLVMLNAEAHYRRCGSRCEKTCAPKCHKPCEVKCKQSCNYDKVEEEPCPDVPCCVRYVRVEEPAQITKHISYTAECPSNCTPEEKAAGMMNAGETWNEGDRLKTLKNY